MTATRWTKVQLIDLERTMEFPSCRRCFTIVEPLIPSSAPINQPIESWLITTWWVNHKFWLRTRLFSLEGYSSIFCRALLWEKVIPSRHNERVFYPKPALNHVHHPERIITSAQPSWTWPCLSRFIFNAIFSCSVTSQPSLSAAPLSPRRN